MGMADTHRVWGKPAQMASSQIVARQVGDAVKSGTPLAFVCDSGIEHSRIATWIMEKYPGTTYTVLRDREGIQKAELEAGTLVVRVVDLLPAAA